MGRAKKRGQDWLLGGRAGLGTCTEPNRSRESRSRDLCPKQLRGVGDGEHAGLLRYGEGRVEVGAAEKQNAILIRTTWALRCFQEELGMANKEHWVICSPYNQS